MLKKSYFSLNEVDNFFKMFVNKATSENGVVILTKYGLVKYGIKMNFLIDDKEIFIGEDYPTLNVGNYREFLNHLWKTFNELHDYYIGDIDDYDMDQPSFYEFVMMAIFVNMSAVDFNNPIDYLDRIIDAWNYDYDPYDRNNKVYIGDMLIKDEKVKIFKRIIKNGIGMETYQHISFSLENEKGEEFYFPRIHFYLANGNAHILGIQKCKEKNDNALCKKVDRYLRKMDKGIEEEQSNDGNVNTIKDVSVSAIGALTLFSSYYCNLKNIYMYDYLPIRYMNKTRNQNEVIREETNRIYKNVVDKFLMSGVRLCEHFNHLDYGFDYGILDIKLGKYKPQTGNIIYDLYEGVNNKYHDLEGNIKR